MKRVYGTPKEITPHAPLRIGLTGGIGCGKSTVASLFSRLGIPVIDADALARELVEPGEPALRAITERFGETILRPDGTLDRAKLRARVFDDPEARRDLEAILHPRIRSAMKERLAQLEAPYAILEIPLLLEAGWQKAVDRILVVDTPPETQIARLLKRGGITRTEAEKIIATQLDRERRLAAADDILLNDVDIKMLEEQVNRLHPLYLEMSR